jgi:predicted DNA-binding protein (UPF0251 family)
MPRPLKRRHLDRQPFPAVYKPAGIALDELNQVSLLPEELEALRLADLQGFSQEESAVQMQVSRSTFQRILTHARRQVALALVEGHALRIEQISPENNPVEHRRSFRESQAGQ